MSTIADIEFGRQLGFFKRAFEKTPSAEDEKPFFNASCLMAVLISYLLLFLNLLQCYAWDSEKRKNLNESDEDANDGSGASGVRGEHVSATL